MIKITTTRQKTQYDCYVTSNSDKVNIGDYVLDVRKSLGKVSLFKVETEEHVNIANNREELEKVIATSNPLVKGVHCISKDFEREFGNELKNYLKI